MAINFKRMFIHINFEAWIKRHWILKSTNTSYYKTSFSETKCGVDNTHTQFFVLCFFFHSFVLFKLKNSLHKFYSIFLSSAFLLSHKIMISFFDFLSWSSATNRWQDASWMKTTEKRIRWRIIFWWVYVYGDLNCEISDYRV